MTTFRAPKGTEDILPPESAWWRRAHRVFDELCEQFGYGETLLPLFEDTEVFARGVGGDTEVVEKQMYSFEDKGGRPITLRPEATASMVRALIQRTRALSGLIRFKPTMIVRIPCPGSTSIASTTPAPRVDSP